MPVGQSRHYMYPQLVLFNQPEDFAQYIPNDVCLAAVLPAIAGKMKPGLSYPDRMNDAGYARTKA